jgi:spore coat protein A
VTLSRRRFLSTASLAAASLGSEAFSASSALTQQVAPQKFKIPHPAPMQTAAPPMLNLSRLAPFVDPLPIPPVLQATALHPDPESPHHSLPYLHIAMRESSIPLHRDLPPTRLWTYAGQFPGPTIEARSGQPLLVRWINALPYKHFLPVDHNLCGAEASNPEVRAVTHLHGGNVPHASDGFPENWFTPGHDALYSYPNHQQAATLWYHDHAMGINRLNVYAGLAGLYLLRDSDEDALNLPRGNYEIPLVLVDRLLDRNAQLYYPTSGDPHAPWVPEVFGDIILVNGKILPYLSVEPRKYRFRILNAANARFFNISLSNGYEFHQIGSDQGLLAAPLAAKVLTAAPAERLDLVVDFAPLHGQTIRLVNDHATPVMEFRVGANPVPDPSSLPPQLRTIERTPEAAAIVTRDLTLDEVETLQGQPMRMLLNNTPWHAPVTETPRLGSTEIWRLINLTDDTHPIHLHMVRFQVLDRRNLDIYKYRMYKKFLWTGAVTHPEPGEMGWKDTVRAFPGAVTRIIVRFDGYAGRYAWHCHLLEHESNEMMRPFQVLPA